MKDLDELKDSMLFELKVLKEEKVRLYRKKRRVFKVIMEMLRAERTKRDIPRLIFCQVLGFTERTLKTLEYQKISVTEKLVIQYINALKKLST